MNEILISFSDSLPKYQQIYNYFRRELEHGGIAAGEKIPSVRELSKSLAVSKTTVERAYLQLYGEGYIESANRSRYTAAKIVKIEETQSAAPQAKPEKHMIKYDFSSASMDRGGFDFGVWRRYIGYATSLEDRLLKYGNPQGEPELRSEIAKYIRRSRGINTSPENIVVGPSVQILLSILCGLLKSDYRSVAFEDPGFKHGRRVFQDYGFEILPVSMGKSGLNPDILEKSAARLVFVSPSHQFPSGTVMPIGRRTRLLAWAARKNALIIEDDYDGEFRYFGNPIPALKGLDGGDRVIYLGSFSKLVPPSIRLAYMVLPETLSAAFKNSFEAYNQAASTVEQLAFAMFMADGLFDRQIRRLRKIYHEKRDIFTDKISRVFGRENLVSDDKSGLFVIVRLESGESSQTLKALAQTHGCRVSFVDDYRLKQGESRLGKELMLYFSGLAKTEISAAVACLKAAWEGAVPALGTDKAKE